MKRRAHISQAEFFQINRPRELQDELWLAHRAEWVANIIMATAPEWIIQERALGKIEVRTGELAAHLSPQESHRRMIKHYQELALRHFEG